MKNDDEWEPKRRHGKSKKKHFCKCGMCGESYEQSKMRRSRNSPNGWVCLDCLKYGELDDERCFVREISRQNWIEGDNDKRKQARLR